MFRHTFLTLLSALADIIVNHRSQRLRITFIQHLNKILMRRDARYTFRFDRVIIGQATIADRNHPGNYPDETIRALTNSVRIECDRSRGFCRGIEGSHNVAEGATRRFTRISDVIDHERSDSQADLGARRGLDCIIARLIRR